MTPKTAISPLAHLGDTELEQLAVEWRARALRGDRIANGAAHALEVEQRRRRGLRLTELPADMPETAPRPWWKFWHADTAAHGGPRSPA